MKNPTLLLINPYIYDFAAYDLWLKPLGLLYIAAILEENGFDIILVDCMDRWHPDVLELQNRSDAKSKSCGTGHFYREHVDTPSVFGSIKRRYSCYGMPPRILEENLQKIQQSQNIDAVLVTSGMTYWYQGAHEVIALSKKYFPQAEVLLGGIYATLCTEHAKQHSGADRVFRGESERSVLQYLSQKFNRPSKEYHGYDDYPYPAYHHYDKLEYVSMMTSRGCPYTCSFCATHEFTKVFQRRIPEKVFEEILHYKNRYQIRNIAFFDDALFINSQKHIKPILRDVIDHHLDLCFHTPNGLFARLLDEELAELMVQANFETIRLSYETKNPQRQKQMRKVRDCDLENALKNLEKAGYKRNQMTVYLLMGLPKQLPIEVEESIHYVNSLGAKASLSSFSPIPNTPEWTIAVKEFGFPDHDPLYTNKSVYPMQNVHFTVEDFERLKALAIAGNRKVMSPELIADEGKISDYNVHA